ncbi:carboxylate--amine ligase [Azospirillum rugosum]|uniref:ATP-grasp superfamily ATP-dependent carboligase n=1 Tax=Azospirillum rugosum TaxID=416170 RepID=A0ABS4SGN5_9PROT|nr:ATP-grasp domain-containing protein [Azospirillum rugosum]MBP2291672.1 putative ATP-grasp superfamily ATP-dependent carboligase [Azospirillum rugosum]MDQ0524516.1 putative ATP-grasp superfamily ATP-dependent carboligase [Azospirillum rugosum]
MKNAFSNAAIACVMGDMDMVRPLGLAGVRCAVVTHLGTPALHSRYTKDVILWEDATKNQDALVEEMVRWGRAQAEKPVLFYQDDNQLLIVSRYRDRLAEAFRIPIADADLIEDLVDKGRFQDLAERLDLPVPATRRLFPTRDLAPVALDLRFPLIIKPLTRRKIWDLTEGFGKALRVNGIDELRALWPKLAAVGLDVLAQEMIPGPETRIESYHVYVDPRGSIAGEFTGRKIRTYPLEYGHSTALTITDEPDVAALGRKMVEALGLTGVAKFDFKRAPDGGLHLLEVNPRFNLWHHLGAVAGVNLPALVYADALGLPRPAVGKARVGACWCSMTKDLKAARESGVPMGEWLSWMMRCEAKALVLDDPMPFLFNQFNRFLPSNIRRTRPVDALKA